jgi:hypothetical protein
MSQFIEKSAIDYILREYARNPRKKKKNYRLISWWRNEKEENDRPLNVGKLEARIFC